MRIINLTPGTGTFYCGTCIRDNALVVALRKLGHDAHLIPMYLPTMLDEPAASPAAPLFYGGVNVYLQQKSALFRKTPIIIDRFFDSAPLLKLAAKQAGATQARDLGELTLSMLRGEEGRQVKELDRLTAWLTANGKPNVVCLSNALLVGLARCIKERTGAAVVCTLQGEDGFLDSLPERDRDACWQTLSERARDLDAFIAVSHYYAEVMTKRAKLSADRVHVVHNGILLDGYATQTSTANTEGVESIPVLGFLARMCPAKGLETLVEAFIELRARDVIKNLKLRIAGSMTAADQPFVDKLRARLEAKRLAGEVEFLPNVSHADKIAFLQSLSALSVPATYGEAFGLYLTEAWAAGVPVVQPHHGAFPELVEASGDGVLCDPDDPTALAVAIEELLSDPARARAMGERGRQAVLEKFSAEVMAANVLRVFERAVKSAGDSSLRSE